MPLDAPAPAEVNDWVTAPTAPQVAGKEVDDWVTAPTAKPSAPDTSAQTEFPTYAAPAPAEGAPGDAAVERIGGAAGNAFMGTPTILTPSADEAVKEGGPVGRYITSPAIHAVDVAHGAGNAAMGALAQTVMEVFGEKGGRDALALLSSLPMAPEMGQLAAARANSPGALANVPAAPSEAATPQFPTDQSVPLAQLDTRNALQKLIGEQVEQDNPALGPRGAPNQGVFAAPSVSDIGSAPDIDTAITAANKVVSAPYSPVTATQVAARDGIGIDAAFARARAENDVGAAQPAPQSMADYMAAQNAPAPAETQPATALAAGPQSVGAAASSPSEANMPSSTMKAGRYDSEMGRILAPAVPGDNTIYVKGSFPTLGERSANPVDAQTEAMLRQRNPTPFKSLDPNAPGRLTAANLGRVNAIDDLTPTGTQLDTATLTRDAAYRDASAKVLPSAAPVDLTQTLQWADDQLADPQIAKNDAVRSTVEKLRASLFDKDGSLETDPAAALGIRANIQH